MFDCFKARNVSFSRHTLFVGPFASPLLSSSAARRVVVLQTVRYLWQNKHAYRYLIRLQTTALKLYQLGLARVTLYTQDLETNDDKRYDVYLHFPMGIQTKSHWSQVSAYGINSLSVPNSSTSSTALVAH